MTITTIFLIIALICFAVDAFKVPTPLNMTALGLGFLTLSFLVSVL